MMIKGLGIDIVEIDRIERSLSKGDGFRNLVFSKSESAYCESLGSGFQSYAGRFAAKEALLKALGTGWVDRLNLFELEVQNDQFGKPGLLFHGESKVSLQAYATCIFHLSISHTEKYATAIVIIEEN